MNISPVKKYDKSNSILELSANANLSDKVLLRLRRAYVDHIQTLNSNDPLALAFHDLFVENNDSPHRFYLRSHVLEEISRIEDEQIPRYLRYRYQYDIYPSKKIISRYPPVVQIEPTSICNYRCIFCYQTDEKFTAKKNGHMGSMDIQMFKKIIDQLDGNVEGITLASRGEPTVNRNLGDMLMYMSGKFLASKLNTNAFLLDEKLSRIILDSGIQTLVFSADAASEPLYSKLRVNGNLNKVLRNIEKFYEIKLKEYSQSKLITRVSGVSYGEEQNIEEMELFWGKYVDQVAFVDYNPWENAYEAKINDINTPCSDLWRRVFVWWDGRVSPCDVDYLATLMDCNINNRNLSEIWTGEEYELLRAKHLNSLRTKISLCSRCVVV